MNLTLSRLSGVVAALAALVLLLPAGTASAKAPREFFGVIGDGPALDRSVDLPAEVAQMRATRVGTLRVAFYWRDMHPQPFEPIDFSETDRIVATAASAGLRVFPTVVRTPGWAAFGDLREGTPPKEPELYAFFVERVVQRYGRGGSFWRENPTVPAKPITSWQVWNEPDIKRYWIGRPWAKTYVKLLKPTYRRIKKGDPQAKAGRPSIS